jgi:hypothetical protein
MHTNNKPNMKKLNKEQRKAQRLRRKLDNYITELHKLYKAHLEELNALSVDLSRFENGHEPLPR